jgi:hypothetical protein
MIGRSRPERLGVSSQQWPEWPESRRRTRVRTVFLGAGVLVAVVAALLCASAVGKAMADSRSEDAASTGSSTPRRC